MQRYKTSILTGAIIFALAACAHGNDDSMSADHVTDHKMKPAAQAALADKSGSTVRGLVEFEKTVNGVRMVADVSGLTPGKHGIHIHENGDCSAPDASSAGGHFNPDDSPHGAPSDPASERHVGDLGNLTADASGNARYERVDKLMALSGPRSILGKAVVIHSGPDDFTSQPSGAAGSRVACGAIEGRRGS